MNMKVINKVKLSDISELITKGTTPTTLGFDFQSSGVNFLKIECFDDNGLYLKDKVAHISDECNNKLKRSQLKKGDILFNGHTHISKIEEIGDILYVNPGSVSIPKENTPRGYIVLTDESIIHKNLQGEVLETYSL